MHPADGRRRGDPRPRAARGPRRLAAGWRCVARRRTRDRGVPRGRLRGATERSRPAIQRRGRGPDRAVRRPPARPRLARRRARLRGPRQGALAAVPDLDRPARRARARLAHVRARRCRVALACVLTQIEFPARYFDLIDRDRVPGRRRGAARPRPARRARPLPRALAPGASARRHQQLLDPRSAPVGAGLDQHPISHGSSSEVSKRTLVIFTKRSSACSRLTPITPPRGPVMPTSVM